MKKDTRFNNIIIKVCSQQVIDDIVRSLRPLGYRDPMKVKYDWAEHTKIFIQSNTIYPCRFGVHGKYIQVDWSQVLEVTEKKKGRLWILTKNPIWIR